MAVYWGRVPRDPNDPDNRKWVDFPFSTEDVSIATKIDDAILKWVQTHMIRDNKRPNTE